MSSLIEFLLHPVALAILGIVLVVALFYLLKSFLKIVIVSILVVFFSVAGYHYYHAEGKFNDRMRDALVGTKAQIESWIDKGKEAASWGKKMLDQRKDRGSRREEPSGKKSRLQEV